MQITVISDVVCPWCFIGKRRLEAALELYAKEFPAAPKPSIEWKPFQLNPEMPEEGIAREEYVRRKFGRPAKEIYAHVESEGKTCGINFQFDKITRQPNTIKAHALIGLAFTHGGEVLQGAVKEALLDAYFLEGGDLTSDMALSDIAAKAGLDKALADECLKSAAQLGLTRQADEEAREMGVSGVPFFIFNNKVAVSGAHPPENLLQAMRQAESTSLA